MSIRLFRAVVYPLLPSLAGPWGIMYAGPDLLSYTFTLSSSKIVVSVTMNIKRHQSFMEWMTKAFDRAECLPVIYMSRDGRLCG